MIASIENIEVGTVLQSIARDWEVTCTIVSMTGPTGSDKSITVVDLGDATERKQVINKRSLKTYKIVG